MPACGSTGSIIRTVSHPLPQACATSSSLAALDLPQPLAEGISAPEQRSWWVPLPQMIEQLEGWEGLSEARVSSNPNSAPEKGPVYPLLCP